MKENLIEIGLCSSCGNTISVPADVLQPHTTGACKCGVSTLFSLNPVHIFRLKTASVLNEHNDYGYAIRYDCPQCYFSFTFPRIEGRMGVALVHTEESLIKEDIITQKKMPFVSEKIHANKINFIFAGYCFVCKKQFSKAVSTELKDLLVYPGTDMKFDKKLTYYVLPIYRARKYFTIKSGNYCCPECRSKDVIFDWQEKVSHPCPNCNTTLEVTPRWSPVKV